MARQKLAIFLVALFCAMSYSPMADATPPKQVDVEIGLGPEGMSDKFIVEVPDGEIVTEFDIEVIEKPWAIDEVITFSEKLDWKNGHSMDGVDYNLSGLRILPMSHEWDFEGSVQGWTLSTGGGWAHGYDSTLGASAGVHSGSSAIYTYNGNYPNNMGITYWATSPTIDCTSCSGSWDLKYWKRLGIESSSYDHAYVSVKTNSGGWTNVYSNPGYVNDGSYTQATHDISTHINGNSAFQVRFGLGRTDSSVTYTGWNVDDVMIEPRGNTGSGSANWTSLEFGPGASGDLHMSHGLMAIDAIVPQGSMMRWSILDASDGSAIPGFIDRQDLSADLSVIDVLEHPTVQLRIQMESSSDSPVINSIKIGGGIIESFDQNPSNNGWTGFSSHSNGIVTGNGMLASPQWRTAVPFSALDLSWDGSGNGHFEVCFSEANQCAGNWKQIPSNGKLSMANSSVILNLRWSGSGSYSIDFVEIDLHRHSSPLNARIDVGLDGVSEWSFSHEAIGGWGLQDKFANGHRSTNLSLNPGGNDVFSLYYPTVAGSSESYHSTGDMMFSLTPLDTPVDGVEVTISIGSNELITQNLGFISEPTVMLLSSSQTQDLVNEMDSRTPEVNIVDQLDAHKVDVSVSSLSGGELLASGLSIPYRYDAQISGDDSLAIIAAINSQLTQISPVNGIKEVPVPIIMSNPGHLTILDYGIQTLGSPEPISLTMSNQTDTLVAGNDWYEFTSKFDLSSIGVSDASNHFSSESWSSIFTLGGSQWTRSASCSIISGTCNTGQGLMIQSFNHSFNGSFVEFSHRVGISSIWPDEEALIVSSSIDMNGPASQPAQLRFGLGWSMGVEQDVDVVDWHLSFMNGAESTWDALYIDPALPGIVEVELAFEDLEDVPRSSSFNVVLYVDGILADSTQVLNDGVATLMFTPNTLATEVDLKVSVTGLSGQEINWKVPQNATFLVDDLAPILLSSNVAPLDHRSNQQPLELEFEIGDRPELPRHSILHLQSSWGGYSSVNLDQPVNLNGFQGTYSKLIDVSDAAVGDSLAGWLEVFDPAGHRLPDSGNAESPLFIISFGPDGAPIILQDGLGWTNGQNWLHPGQNYSIQIPIQDVNGYGDIQEVEVDLSSDSNEDLIIQWSAMNGCSTSSIGIIIQDCSILGDTHHFEPMFTLEVVLSFAWDFNADSSMERQVRITASDDSGQSHSNELDGVWKYSSEMEIDLASVAFSNNSAFIAPEDVGILTADVVWTKSGQLVNNIIDVVAYVDGVENYGISVNGTTDLQVIAPNSTGIFSITMDLVNLPSGAIDRTVSDDIVAWMVVDGNAPKVLQVLSPNPLDLVQERDWKNLSFEIMVNENEGLDLDSMRMQWLLIPHGMEIPELALLGGNVSMDLIAGTGAGNSIPLSGIIDVDSLIPELSRGNSWDLWIWVEGHDMAGHEIEATFNSRTSPLAIFQLANRDSDLRIESKDIIIPSENKAVGETILLNITIHNDGQISGLTSIRVEVVEDGDNRRLVDIVNVDVPAGSSKSFEVKWIPESDGTAWVEISTPDGMTARTDAIQIEKEESSFMIEGLDGASDAMLTGFAIIAFLMLGLLGYLVVSGKKSRQSIDFEEEFA